MGGLWKCNQGDHSNVVFPSIFLSGLEVSLRDLGMYFAEEMYYRKWHMPQDGGGGLGEG